MSNETFSLSPLVGNNIVILILIIVWLPNIIYSSCYWEVSALKYIDDWCNLGMMFTLLGNRGQIKNTRCGNQIFSRLSIGQYLHGIVDR